MGVRKYAPWWVECDGPVCLRFATGSWNTKSQAEEIAAQQGWVNAGKAWYCPECWAYAQRRAEEQ